MISAAPKVHETGASPGTGTFSCVRCGAPLSLEALDQLPDCPRCGSSSFRRSSIFDQPLDQAHLGHTVEFDAPEPDDGPPAWLDDAREQLSEPGMYLAYFDDGPTVIELEHGWSRIGRSATADVRLDHPTVSRRHALLVWEPGESLRVLDDRSLNGVFLNGELVEWGSLSDGDELAVGRYRLFLLEA